MSKRLLFVAVVVCLLLHFTNAANRKNSETFINPGNPYCRMCQTIFNDMESGKALTLAQACQRVPYNQQTECDEFAKMMVNNKDVKKLLAGCMDKTGANLGSNDLGVKSEGKCPGVLACNIIEARTGLPMCGDKLRGWADYLPESAKAYGPVRPALRDNSNVAADGHTLASNGGVVRVNFAPPGAGSKIVGGNPECDMCIDVFNALQRTVHAGAKLRRRLLGNEATTAGSAVCKGQPNSLKQKCEEFYAAFKENQDVKELLQFGCMDRSGTDPIEMDPGKCSGEVACNAIHHFHGGPMCGREFGVVGSISGHSPVAKITIKLP